MNTSLTATGAVRASRAEAATRDVIIPQYSRRAIAAVWAAAALPMAAMAWLIAPLIEGWFVGERDIAFAKALLVSMCLGLIWQSVLVVILVGREQRSLRWSTLREALWLRAPSSPGSGRAGGWLWLLLIPLVVVFAAGALLLPAIPHPADRDFGALLGSDTGREFLGGAWGWYSLILVQMLFNTVLGEELLFRGFLLPRMNGAFGRADWVANGGLFAAYHLHVPWMIPAILLDTFTLAYSTKRYRSAWMGIAVHSSQTVFLGIAVTLLVL